MLGAELEELRGMLRAHGELVVRGESLILSKRGGPDGDVSTTWSVVLRILRTHIKFVFTSRCEAQN